jgi:hypothetical protein
VNTAEAALPAPINCKGSAVLAGKPSGYQVAMRASEGSRLEPTTCATTFRRAPARLATPLPRGRGSVSDLIGQSHLIGR